MVHILPSYKKTRAETCVIEILDKNSLSYYQDLGFPKSLIETLKSNLNKKKDKEEVMIFYIDYFNCKKVVALFPSTDGLSDTRSEILRKYNKKTFFIPSSDFIQAFEIFSLATYTYDVFLTKKEEKIHEFYVPENVIGAIEKIVPLVEAIIRTRDIINLPPSETRPEAFVEYIQRYPWKNFKLRILDAHALKQLGCNLLLAVGSGSDYPPYMIVLERIIDESLDTYALIGKGVTFDSGGLQIKPDMAMLDMKMDMSGAAGMLGVAEFLDGIPSLNVNIIVGLGITENVINGKAFKPLDIYKAHNGTTVEIHHTDAEGRLVLADVMSYIEGVYNPGHMITMATLTGACMQALGNDIAGIMGDDEKVIAALLNSTSPYEKTGGFR